MEKQVWLKKVVVFRRYLLDEAGHMDRQTDGQEDKTDRWPQ